MAADTVPAAVPDPHNPPAGSTTNTPQRGALTSLFAAVDPARPAAPAFDLNPTTETAGRGANDETASGASSAAFHNDENTPQDNPKSTANTRQERGVIRAWLLAGAERWKKGADARNKRLDISKAKANAFQVKETRTVSVNRAGGGLFGATSNRSGGGSGAAGGGKPGNGKGLGSKDGSGNGPKGPKNKPGPSGNGSAGRSGNGGGTGRGGGGGGRGPSGGSGGQSGAGQHGPKNSPKNGNGNGSGKGSGGDTGGTTKTDKTKTPKTPSPKNSPDSKSSTAKDGKNGPAGAGKAGPQGPAGPTSKTPPAPAPAPVPGGGKNDTPKDSVPKTGPKPDASTDTKKSPAADKVSLDKTSKTKKTDTPKDPDLKTPDPKDDPKASPKDPKDSKDPKGPTAPDTKTPQKPGTTPATGQGTQINTQDSRETGYRDGTRTAKAVAHVQAYRDGFKDGHRDTTEAAEREKDRLDKAHQQRKQELQQQREKDVPVTGQASSADYHPPKPTEPPPTTPAPAADPDNEVKPVWARGISADTVDLYSTNASYRLSMSRGEVRTLRRFQQRLEHKTSVMTRIVDATRVLEQHAQEQAKAVIKLLEQAKAVKGGDKLAGKLAKLADDAMVQATKAAELHKRSLRAAEASQALHANTSKRYEPIYQAVVNSPLTTPAELAYYREMDHA